MNLSLEKKWIISCLQGKIHPPVGLELIKIIEICNDEGIGPLLFKVTKEEPQLPTILIKNLRAQYTLSRLNIWINLYRTQQQHFFNLY